MNEYGITNEELKNLRSVVAKINGSQNPKDVGTAIFDLLKPTSNELVLCLTNNNKVYFELLESIIAGKHDNPFLQKKDILSAAFSIIERRDVEYTDNEMIQIVVYGCIHDKRRILTLKPPVTTVEDTTKKLRLCGGHVALDKPDVVADKYLVVKKTLYPAGIKITDWQKNQMLVNIYNSIILDNLYKEISEELLTEGKNSDVFNRISKPYLLKCNMNNSMSKHVFVIYNLEVPSYVLDTQSTRTPEHDGIVNLLPLSDLFSHKCDGVVDDIIRSYIPVFQNMIERLSY